MRTFVQLKPIVKMGNLGHLSANFSQIRRSLRNFRRIFKTTGSIFPTPGAVIEPL